MTDRQQKFAEYYAACGNVTQAALKAGYSEKYAKSDACRILENPSVADYLRKLTGAARAERVLSAVERQEMLSVLAKDPVNEPKDRIRAIDVLNRMTGEYTVRLDATVQPSAKLASVMEQISGQGLSDSD